MGRREAEGGVRRPSAGVSAHKMANEEEAMGETCTRADLTEAVYRKLGLSRTECASIVEFMLREMSNRIAKGEKVKLS